MYEKSIGGEHRIFAVTVPLAHTLALDLLNPTDRADYDKMITTGVETQPYQSAPYTMNHQIHARFPVDGYIYSDFGNLYISTSSAGAKETIPPYTQYPIPVFFWLNKTWFSSDGDTNALIRIFFS